MAFCKPVGYQAIIKGNKMVLLPFAFYIVAYFTVMGRVASGSPSHVTVSVAVPGRLPSTMTTSWPLKSGIWRESNVTSDVPSRRPGRGPLRISSACRP